MGTRLPILTSWQNKVTCPRLTTPPTSIDLIFNAVLCAGMLEGNENIYVTC